MFSKNSWLAMYRKLQVEHEKRCAKYIEAIRENTKLRAEIIRKETEIERLKVRLEAERRFSDDLQATVESYTSTIH